MSLEEKLLSLARDATKDDSIVDVAIFHPRGYSGSMGTGAAAGSVIGGDSGAGSAIGAAIGGLAGMEANKAIRDLPRSICVAISPSTVYLMAHEGATDYAGVVRAPFATMDRSEMGVEVHQRAMNRVVVLHDDRSDQTYEMEAPRVGPYHAKAAVELLMLSDRHHERVES